MCEKRIDRPLDNHVDLYQNIVNLVAGRRLRSLIGKTVFKRITPHSQVRRIFFILFFRHAQWDCIPLVLLGKSETCRHSLIR